MKLSTNQRFIAGLLDAFETQGMRTDAGEVAFVAKDLEYVMSRTYDIEFPELKALQLIPINTEVDPGATEYSYGQWKTSGKAMFITDYAKDFPTAEADLTRFAFLIQPIGVGYAYTIQDLRASAMRRLSMGKSLDQARAAAAALAHAQFVDQVAAFGDVKRGLTGFVNNTDIPTVSLTFGSWNLLDTSDTSQGKIASDLTQLAMAPELATLGLYVADTLLLPLSMKPRLYQPTSTMVRQPLILNWLSNNDNIKNIVWWNRLDAANSGGAYVANEAIAMAYKKDPGCLYYVIPLQFTQHPPQQIGLTFHVPCESRTGGVCMPRPLSAARANTHS